MLRKDIHRIVSRYFNIQLSPKGILYDTAKDIIVTRIFKPEDLPRPWS
jgi:hypothetical protein